MWSEAVWFCGFLVSGSPRTVGNREVYCGVTHAGDSAVLGLSPGVLLPWALERGPKMKGVSDLRTETRCGSVAQNGHLLGTWDSA